ncbi:MAG: hypothetical protein MR681_06195 [Prevotella sp.]|nr:hypothetical protein [Prevotella sp.]
MDKKDSILKNTIFLYIRSFFTLIIYLYTSRLVLKALGIEEFGVYQLVGGIVAALSFINSTMTVATQRFISYEIGIGDKSSIQNVFSTAINVHMILSLIVFILIEVVGMYLLHTHLDIGKVNVLTADWILLFTTLSLVLTINSVPYNSMLVSKENMSYFAYVDILGAILKLGIVYILFLIQAERLILYAFLMFIVSLIIRVIYVIVCRRVYTEARYIRVWDKKLNRKILTFSGWTSLAAFTYMIKNQGLAIILNLFFGPLLNAAIGISAQVNSAVRTFSQNFQMSFSPQIVKTYAQNDFKNMNSLIYSGAKLSTYLLLVISLPIIIETEYILNLWLNVVPQYAVVLVQLTLIETIVQTMTCTGNQAIRATGKVKFFEIVYNFTELMALPTILFCLYVFKVYYLPYIILLIFIFISNCVKIYFLKKQIDGFDAYLYFKDIVLITFLISGLVLILPMYIKSTFVQGLSRFIGNCFIIEISLFGLIYYLGMNNLEKNLLLSVYRKCLQKINK